jgi:hypothetical protein
MKRLKILLLVLFLVSCTKEKIDKNIQVYYFYYSDYRTYSGDNIVKFMGYNSLYSEYIEAGQIKKGKLTLDYNVIDEKYCRNIIDVFHYLPSYINISNNEAKIMMIPYYNIYVFNQENEEVGHLQFNGYDCSKIHICGGVCSTIYFIYATEETKITGERDDSSRIYNLDLKKGWNKIYYYENNLFQEIYTTNSKNFPPGNWQIR